jgi:hypothetical protein
MKLLVEHRPTKTGKKPWVVLMPTASKPLIVARTATKEEAEEAIVRAGHEVTT